MNEIIAKVFVTKWAFTLGIVEMKNVTLLPSGSVWAEGYYVIHKRFCHSTIEEARVHAEKQRAQRIVALERKAAALRRLSFAGTVPVSLPEDAS